MYEVRNDADMFISKHMTLQVAKLQANVLAKKAKELGDTLSQYSVFKVEEVYSTFMGE